VGKLLVTINYLTSLLVLNHDTLVIGLPPAMMLPSIPQSLENEEPIKCSLRDHADLPRGDIDKFEVDLPGSNTDNFEQRGDSILMPSPLQDPSSAVDSIQSIPQLKESQDDWDYNEDIYDINDDLYADITATDPYEHPGPISMSQPLIVSQIPAQHQAQKRTPTLKLIPPVHDSITRPLPSPRQRTTSLPQRNNKPTTEDSDSTTQSPPPRTISESLPTQSDQLVTEDSDLIAEDPYLAFSTDLESLDISKLTLEQLDQIDPRQAQIWMLLKMHQMIRKVEDVYESAEQLYSVRQAPDPSPIPKKPNVQDDGEDKHENTLQRVKRPIPRPRQNVARHQSEQGDPSSTTQEFSTKTSEAMQQESKSVKDTPQKVYRQQKIIGKLLLITRKSPYLSCDIYMYVYVCI
jgi:hypothetical protein